MNLLQHISEAKYGPVLVTLNSPMPLPDENKVVGRFQYDHPVISGAVRISQIINVISLLTIYFSDNALSSRDANNPE